MNIKIITSFTHHKTAEGDRLSYTFSEIDPEGSLVKSNERATCLVLDQEILKNIGAVNEFLQTKLV